MPAIVNIAAYQFVDLAQKPLLVWCLDFKTQTQSLDLKGTILLSPEGINLFLAGTAENIASFKAYLQYRLPELGRLNYRETYSAAQPFKRMLVKVKKQMISYPDLTTPTEGGRAPYLKPEMLKTWLQERQAHLVLLDARNTYEVAVGSFQNAIQLGLKHFREWPEALQKLPECLKEQTVVTFCTGGIRCEKAAATLIQRGFKSVYQLEGGILNYFERCGNAYYEGGCFVFDERGAIDANA